jgi:hypothetical protein
MFKVPVLVQRGQGSKLDERLKSHAASPKILAFNLNLGLFLRVFSALNFEP